MSIKFRLISENTLKKIFFWFLWNQVIYNSQECQFHYRNRYMVQLNAQQIRVQVVEHIQFRIIGQIFLSLNSKCNYQLQIYCKVYQTH